MVAQNLNMQAEVVSKETDPMQGILAPEGPSRLALPLIKTIQNQGVMANTRLYYPHG